MDRSDREGGDDSDIPYNSSKACSSRWEGASGMSRTPLPNGADDSSSVSDDKLMATVATVDHAGKLKVVPRQRR